MTTIAAEFHSIWDQGYDVKTPCTVDLQFGLVVAEVSDEVEGIDLLDHEYVQLPGSHVEHEIKDIGGKYFVVNLEAFAAEATLGLV